MSPISRLMQPLRRLAQAFFRSDVTLRRDRGSVRLMLADRMTNPTPQAPSSAVEQAVAKQRRELQLMLSQLADVLGEQPDTRDTLRHLVFVEQALTKKGLRALKRMPLEVLTRALDQFEGLVTNWSPEGLANLRSKMAVTVIERETHPGMTEPGGLDSMFDPARIEAVLDAPRVEAVKAIEAARESSFADSTIERLAFEFGVGRQQPAARMHDAVEMQGELDSPSAKALGRESVGTGGKGGTAIRFRDLEE